MGKTCQFIGVIVWIVGIKVFWDTYNLLKDFGDEGGVFDSNYVQSWIPVFCMFIYGVILWVLGTIYDAAIKIKENIKKTDMNWNSLFTRLEQLERKPGQNMGVPKMPVQPNSASQNNAAWICPECGHGNSLTDQMCSMCGFPRDRK